jgi:ketosteroid isomerase-like protein
MSRALSIGTLLVITAIPPLTACGTGADIETEREGLLTVDREFAQASVQFGAAQAFYMYMADAAAMLPNGSERVVGPESIRDFMEASRGMTLDWVPIDGAVAASGDLGYTWGTWEATTPDVETGGAAISTGRYVTVWRRDADGSWRVLLDMGNNGAPPESEEGAGEPGE